MIGIVKLNIEIQVIGSQADIDRITENPSIVVAEDCFENQHRRVLKAEVLDIELTDADVDVIKMLDTRKVSGETIVERQPEH